MSRVSSWLTGSRVTVLPDMGPVLMLLLAAFFWGSGNVANKTVLTDIDPWTAVVLWCLVAVLVLAPFCVRELRATPADQWLASSLFPSALLAGALALQQWAHETATVTNASFLVNAACVLTPLIAFALFRKAPGQPTILAATVLIGLSPGHTKAEPAVGLTSRPPAITGDRAFAQGKRPVLMHSQRNSFMPNPARRLSLTKDHIALIHRVVEDGGPAPGVHQQTDDDYADWVSRIAASHPDRSRPTQLFAYGSLIWKPEGKFLAERKAVAQGWHRAFCLRTHRFRGTPDVPGLMMALVPGGQCRGVVYELPQEDIEAQLDRLFRREFTVKPINNMPRWLQVQTDAGPMSALGFVMNRASPYFAGRLQPDEVARTLAAACGHWGSGAEYLLNTVTQLEARGIHDSSLWRLQRLVAQEIERRFAGQNELIRERKAGSAVPASL